MEGLWQARRLHNDFRCQGEETQIGFRQRVFYPKINLLSEFQPVFNKLGNFPTGYYAHSKIVAARSIIKNLPVLGAQLFRQANPPDPNMRVQQNPRNASHSSVATGSNGSMYLSIEPFKAKTPIRRFC